MKKKPGIPYYPWEDWFNAGEFVVKKGKDFSCMVHSMAQQIRNQATRRGIPISIKIVGNKITATVCEWE